MQTKPIGFLLAIAGSLLVIYKSRWVPIPAFITWHFLFIVIGLFLIYLAFVTSNAPIALLGGFIASINLSAWGEHYIKGWPTHWSIFIIMLGISFLLNFKISKNNTMFLIGITLLLSGIFACPGIKEIPALSPIAQNLHTYWPLCFVGLGIIMMLRK